MRSLTLFIAALGTLVASHGAERVPTTKVALEPPAGLVRSQPGPGFEHPEERVAIGIMEFADGLEAKTPHFSDEAIGKLGGKVLKRENVKIAGDTGILIKMSQATDGGELASWLLLLGDDKATVMVKAVFPPEQAADWEEKLKKTLLAVEWKKDAVIPPFEGVPYRVSETENMKVAKVMGQMVILTLGGRFPEKDTSQPVLITTGMLEGAAVPPDKRQESAKYMLQTSTIASEIKITSERKREIGGLEAIELEAEGMHGEPGQPVKLKSLMIFVEDGFFFLQSRVGSKNHDQYAPELAKIFDSFKLEKP